MKTTIARTIIALLTGSTASVRAATNYVSLSGSHTAPYTNWVTAATNIQDAVNVATNAGDVVLVTNGTYFLSSEITVENAITVESVNGRDVTIVDGQNTTRCFNLGSAACTISGFSIINGKAEGAGSENYGGGIYCAVNPSPVITNCTFSGNSADYGGGSFLGTLNNCTFTSNSANSGGGCSAGTLNNCLLSGNSANSGGGSYGGTLNNCTFTSNSAKSGGGSDEGTLNHCTITGNSANYGGGCSGSIMNNCIVYFNTAQESDDNWQDPTPTISYCCTTPDPGGAGNITDDPQFMNAAGGDYRLASGSPCIDTGTNLNLLVDFAGTPRPLDGDATGAAVPDMGAYEFYNPAGDSDADGLTDGLETDTLGTSIVNTNTDGDAYSDYEEYVATTDGADPDDFFRIIDCTGRTVWFRSSSNRIYTLLWSWNLEEGFWSKVREQTDIAGSGGLDSLTDPHNDPSCFFKVQVEIP